MKSASPMSFMKAKQKQTLKRASSCPDVHKIEEIVAAKNDQKINDISSNKNKKNTPFEKTDVNEDNENNDDTVIQDDKAANVCVQTDEFLVSPYEHLFPFVLPQWMSCGAESKNVSNYSIPVVPK